MHLRCPHCTVVAIGQTNPRTIAENAFWTLSKHINDQHRDQTFLCKRRDALHRRPASIRTHRDFWLTETNGDRTCSCCGSLHEDDFRQILHAFIDGKQGYVFKTTDKPDKVYASRPGVNNPRQGGTKFYLQHAATLPDPSLHALGALFEQALWRETAISSE